MSRTRCTRHGRTLKPTSTSSGLTQWPSTKTAVKSTRTPKSLRSLPYTTNSPQTAFHKSLNDKKLEIPDQTSPPAPVKLKLNLQQPSTKIKLHVPSQKPATPPAAPPPLKRESPVLAPQQLPPRPGTVRQSSPLKNQVLPSPVKSPPSLRPAPPKPLVPQTPKENGVPLGDWARQPLQNRGMTIQTSLQRGPQTPLTPRTGMVIPPSMENGIRASQSIMFPAKRDRSLTLMPLVTITTEGEEGLVWNITSPAPPTSSTQTLCLTLPSATTQLSLTAHLTKDLTLQGSYTFTVTCNNRKLAPTVWPDSSRRSGTTDTVTVAPHPNPPVPVPSTLLGDTWKFTVPLGEPGSVSCLEAGCTAFLKRDERGLLVRGERSRTGQAAGEDGGEVERVVLLILRGR
jgi:hypothetical protein